LVDIIANLVIISSMKRDIFAIVGPTASGKSDLALNLAQKLNSVILSVDSLSVYKEIDIASAKPTAKERGDIVHFGIDVLYPNQNFSVASFLSEFKNAKEYAKANNKSLIIVGGTSFYLKVLTNGISQIPQISNEAYNKAGELLQNKAKAYEFLQNIDFEYAKNIKSNDTYRLQKALELYFQTKIKPSSYFAKNPPKPIEPSLPIYEIKIPRETLREKIAKRTAIMIDMGIIDEVAYLESKYTREPNSMKAIGIKECLDYLDGKLNINELHEKITTNTARLAKRQVTFNKSQLNIAFSGSVEDIMAYLLRK